MSDANTTSTPAPSMDNDKVMAAIATIPYIGAIMYYAVKDLSDLAKFYAKQSIGLTVLSIALFVISIVTGFLSFIPVVGILFGCLGAIAGLAGFLVGILWLVLLINALQGNKYRLPVMADLVDKYVK